MPVLYKLHSGMSYSAGSCEFSFNELIVSVKMSLIHIKLDYILAS